MRNREYSEQLYVLKDELGLSMSINPELLAAKEIYRLLQIPAFIKRDTFAEGRAEIVELGIEPESPLCGLRLSDMGSKIHTRTLVCAVVRDGKAFIPDGRFVLEAGDRIYATAPASALVELTHELKLRSKRSKNVLIVGGGRIAEYLTPMLAKSGAHVKIIEMDRKRCEYLSEALPEATIICSDGSKQAVLKMHNIARMDAVLPMTDMDEENIIIGMFARKVGVPQLLTKINRSEYGEILGDRGADSLISPKQISSRAIVRYVRAMENTGGSAGLCLCDRGGARRGASACGDKAPEHRIGVERRLRHGRTCVDSHLRVRRYPVLCKRRHHRPGRCCIRDRVGLFNNGRNDN